MSSRKVENFILKDQSGNDFELYKNLNKAVLLIFYPKDGSSVCSRQLDNYQKNINVFEEAGIQPVGINIESVGTHNSFCNRKNIQFPLLSDNNKEISRRFNALNLFSVNKRRLVLINTDREIAYERNIPVFKYDNTAKILEDLRTKHII
jgi:peroxiredoxin Q/BCP